jgi:hypothetical protein
MGTEKNNVTCRMNDEQIEHASKVHFLSHDELESDWNKNGKGWQLDKSCSCSSKARKKRAAEGSLFSWFLCELQ